MRVAALERPLRQTDVQCSLLQKKRLTLQDAIDFLEAIDRELAVADQRNRTIGTLHVMTIAVAMTTDIIWDSVSGTVKTTPAGAVGMSLLRKLYDKAQGKKWDGAKYKAEAEKIKKIQDTLKKALPKGTRFLADTLGNMAQNMIGMIGAAEGWNEVNAGTATARKQNQKSLKQLRDVLGAIDKELQACAPQVELRGPA